MMIFTVNTTFQYFLHRQVFDLLVFVLTRFFFDLSCCPYLPLASEETFARVARALSKCPSASDGGDLGVFQPGELDPAFDRRLNATGAGIIVDQSILNIGIAYFPIMFLHTFL